MTTDLPPGQLRLLRYIAEHLRDHGRGPTIRKIGAALGIASPNGVMCHVTPLLRKGLILRPSGHSSRGLVIPVVADATKAAAAAFLEGL